MLDQYFWIIIKCLIVDGERFRVRILLNEMGVVPPFCRKHDHFGMCPLHEFANHFMDKTGGQNFSEICNVRMLQAGS